jgi:hypothetical protein
MATIQRSGSEGDAYAGCPHGVDGPRLKGSFATDFLDWFASAL